MGVVVKKVVAILLVGLLAMAGCQHGKNYRDPRGLQSPTVSATSASPTPPPLAQAFVQGTHEIGKDVKPGRYETEASFSTGTCVLTIKDKNQKFVARFTIRAGQGIQGVELRLGQFATATGGCNWKWYEPNK